MVLAAKDTFQLAYVAKNLHSAADYFVKRLGVGPFFQIAFEDLEVVYRNKPVRMNAKIAWGYRGLVEYELIESDFPHYQDFRSGRDIALHHAMKASETFDADLAAYQAMGCEAIFELPATCMRYMDTLYPLGHYTELVNYSYNLAHNRKILERKEAMWKASVNWDGENPLRPAEFVPFGT